MSWLRIEHVALACALYLTGMCLVGGGLRERQSIVVLGGFTAICTAAYFFVF